MTHNINTHLFSESVSGLFTYWSTEHNIMSTQIYKGYGNTIIYALPVRINIALTAIKKRLIL